MIPDEIRDHIFEPFFTTKEGSGTGLGLATVYGIVRQNGGTVRLDTDRERGTRFEIWLPASSRDVEPGPSRHEEPHGIRGTERVLVVEDDPSVRDLMAASLRRYGYEIVQTSGAEEALDWLEDRSNRIDLLLTDLVMPGISGVELSRRAASLRPGLRVLLVSGYSDGLAPGAVGELGLSFLEKPFTPGVLAERVRDVLDGEP